jgi:general secretion pathway protein G
MKNAFTMIELLFVIVIIGILASIAIPKLSGTKRQAEIASGRADVAAIRSAIISERQTQLVKGVNTYISTLSDSDTTLFTGDGTRKLLLYGIKAGNGSGDWSVIAGTTRKSYNYKVDTTLTRFDYNATSGIFGCTADAGDCNALVD